MLNDSTMGKLWIWILLTLIVFSGLPAAAQLPISNSDAVWKVLDDGVQKKLMRADKIMVKALDYTKRADTYEKQIEALRNDKGRIKFGKIRKLERRRNSSIVQSKPYYQDGYTLGYKALGKQISLLSGQAKGSDVNVDELSKKSKDRYKQGNKFYKKSERLAKAQQQIEMIVLGNQKMKEALTVQVQTIEQLKQSVFAGITEPVAIEPVSDVQYEPQPQPELAPVITVPTEQSAAVVVPEVVAAVAIASVSVPDSNIINETISTETVPVVAASVPEELGDVFITIQIMSVKTAATPEQIMQVYSGSKKVMQLVSADYYRYAVGKFRSVDEAKAAMAAENIKGIVVAFKGSERISVAEATAVLSATVK
jgi:hypothetical protein